MAEGWMAEAIRREEDIERCTKGFLELLRGQKRRRRSVLEE